MTDVCISFWLFALQERVVKRILELDTPLGGEITAILQEKQPDSRLLRERSFAAYGDTPQPRLPSAAAVAMRQVCS